MEAVQTLVRRSARLYQRVSAFVILAGAFVCLLYFLGYFLLNSNFAKQSFDALVNAEIRGKVSWTRLAWGPRPSQLRILEPLLLDSAGRPVVQAKTITIDNLDILGLLDGRISAQGVHINAPTIRLVSRPVPDGVRLRDRSKYVLNITEMFWPPGMKIDDGYDDPIDLNLTDVSIKDAVFVMDMEKTSVVSHGVQIPNATFRVYTSGMDEHVVIKAGEVSARSGHIRVALDTALGRPLAATGDAILSFPFEKMIIREFNWHGDQFNIGRIETKLRDDPLLLEAVKMKLKRPGLPHFTGRLSLSTTSVERHLTLLEGTPFKGAATIVASAVGELDALDAKASIKSAGISAYGVSVKDLGTEITHSASGVLRVTSFASKLGEGRLQARGEFDLSEGYGLLELFPYQVPTKALPIPWNRETAQALGGRITGAITATISDAFSETPLIGIRTQLRSSRTRKRPYGLGRVLNLDTYLESKDQALTIERLALSTNGTRLRTTGLFDLDTYMTDLSGRLSLNQIGAVSRALGNPLDGAVRIGFKAKGFILKPRVQADFTGRRIKHGDLPPADVKGKILFHKGRLDLDRFLLTSEQGSVSLKGSVFVSKRGHPVDVRINARKFELASLPLGHGISGRAALDFRLKGPIKKPQISGRGRVGQHQRR